MVQTKKIDVIFHVDIPRNTRKLTFSCSANTVLPYSMVELLKKKFSFFYSCMHWTNFRKREMRQRGMVKQQYTVCFQCQHHSKSHCLKLKQDHEYSMNNHCTCRYLQRSYDFSINAEYHKICNNGTLFQDNRFIRTTLTIQPEHILFRRRAHIWHDTFQFTPS